MNGKSARNFLKITVVRLKVKKRECHKGTKTLSLPAFRRSRVGGKKTTN